MSGCPKISGEECSRRKLDKDIVHPSSYILENPPKGLLLVTMVSEGQMLKTILCQRSRKRLDVQEPYKQVCKPPFGEYNTGPLGVIVLNAGYETFEIAHGDRIAQLVVAPVVQARFDLADDLSDTTRGAGGFGSTGRG